MVNEQYLFSYYTKYYYYFKSKIELHSNVVEIFKTPNRLQFATNSGPVQNWWLSSSVRLNMTRYALVHINKVQIDLK